MSNVSNEKLIDISIRCHWEEILPEFKPCFQNNFDTFKEKFKADDKETEMIDTWCFYISGHARKEIFKNDYQFFRQNWIDNGDWDIGFENELSMDYLYM